MSNFTPGPWRIGKARGSVVADTNDFLTVRGSYDDECKEYYGGYLIGESITPSNAELISAAPDLLKACEDAKKYLERDLVEPGRTVFWNLVNAIKKAKGGENNDRESKEL